MSQPRIKKFLPVVIIILAVLLGRGLILMQSAPPKKPMVQPKASVEVQVVKRGPLQLSIQSQGTVTAKRRIEWGSKVAGRVIWVAPEFVEGGEIAPATTLLKLDPTDYRVAVAEAEASLADANLALTEERNELRRGTNYRANNQQSAAASLRQPKLEQVESRVRAAEEKLKQAQSDLAATEIKAPFAAIIDKKQVDLGQYVSTGTILFNLMGTDIAEVRLPVTAADIRFIKYQQGEQDKRPAVELGGSFGRDRVRWQGSLARIERKVDPDTRTFFVVAEVEQPYNTKIHNTPLATGLFVDADIEGLHITDGVRIPRAVLHRDDTVYLAVDGLLQRRKVEVLRREKDSLVIGEGLNDGELLVVTKLDLMVEGMPVTAMGTDTSNVVSGP